MSSNQVHDASSNKNTTKKDDVDTPVSHEDLTAAEQKLYLAIIPFMSIVGIIGFIGEIAEKLSQVLKICQLIYLIFVLLIAIPCFFMAISHKSIICLLLGIGIMILWFTTASWFKYSIQLSIELISSLKVFKYLKRGIDGNRIETEYEKKQLKRNIITFLGKLTTETTIAKKIKQGIKQFLLIKKIFINFAWYFDTSFEIFLSIIFGIGMLLCGKAIFNEIFYNSYKFWKLWHHINEFLTVSIGLILVGSALTMFVIWYLLSTYMVHPLWDDSKKMDYILKNLDEIEQKGNKLVDTIQDYINQESKQREFDENGKAMPVAGSATKGLGHSDTTMTHHTPNRSDITQ